MIKEVFEVVQLDSDGRVYDVLQDNLASYETAETWIKDHEALIGGRMSAVRVTIRKVFVID